MEKNGRLEFQMFIQNLIFYYNEQKIVYALLNYRGAATHTILNGNFSLICEFFMSSILFNLHSFPKL